MILRDVSATAEHFPFHHPREIFAELREASRGGHADYYGITYERLDREMGVFWPCPAEDHPGTPRLFEGGNSFIPMERPDSSSRTIGNPAIRSMTSFRCT